jgi:hypothetical protein
MTETEACPHTDRSDDALCVLPNVPPNAHYVRCPCCGLTGWQTDDDHGPPMVCPGCLVEAVVVPEPDREAS